MNNKNYPDKMLPFILVQIILGTFIASRVGVEFELATLKYTIAYFLFGGALILTSVGILRLSNLARLIGIIFASFFVCGFTYMAIRLIFQFDSWAFITIVLYSPVFLFYIAFLFYFTRPKVKQLFKKGVSRKIGR